METEECAMVVDEFQHWFETHQDGCQSNDVILFLQEHHRAKDGAVRMEMAFSDDATFTIVCPFEYPHGKNLLFDVRSTNDRLQKDWLPRIRAFAQEHRGQVKLPAVLSKCVQFHRECSGAVCSGASTSKMPVSPPSPEDSDFEDEPGAAVGSGPSTDGEMEDLIYSDDNFTTQWDIEMDFLKKRWLIKEKEMRAKLNSDTGFLGFSMPSSSGVTNVDPLSVANQLPSTVPKGPNKSSILDGAGPVHKKTKFDEFSGNVKAGQQIFEHESAAFQILSNEMIALLKTAKNESAHGGQCHFACKAVDDNLYQWRVNVGAFPVEHPLYQDLAVLKSKFGYDTIELQLDFVSEFPFYPPLLRLVRPRLKGSLVQSLANIEILKLTFWNPAKSVLEVLKEIKEILLQHARLDVENERNDNTKFPEGAYLPLEDYLIKLALATEAGPRANFQIITVENLERAPQLRTKPTLKSEGASKAGGWRAGVGYGSGSRTSGWNPESYVIAQQEKDKQILEILKNVAIEINSISSLCEEQETSEVNSVIEGSCLLPFLEQQLSVGSFIEIGRHLELYKLVLEVVEAISNVPHLLPLLCNLPRQKFCIMAYLSNLEASASQYLECMKGKKSRANGAKAKQTQKQASKSPVCEDQAEKGDQELTNAVRIVELFAKLKSKLDNAKLVFSTEEQRVEEMDSAADSDQSMVQRYVRHLQPLQFATVELNLTGQWAHKYAKSADDKLSKEVRTIWKEWTALKTSLPLNLESSVFVRVDESHMNLMQALITGPEGTPYANGCFVFDICFPLNYPSKPPQVNLRTTGGGRVRFNPNLYHCGKVCLSLLGTWSGDSGENWNEKTSTILQVLVSIQSLILVEEPYFNEPGYEKTIGTEEGKRSSDKYNKEVRANCLRHAMLEQLQQPPPGFENIIRLHFQVKKDAIVKQLEGWVGLDSDNRSLKGDVQKLKKQLSELPAVE